MVRRGSRRAPVNIHRAVLGDRGFDGVLFSQASLPRPTFFLTKQARGRVPRKMMFPLVTGRRGPVGARTIPLVVGCFFQSKEPGPVPWARKLSRRSCFFKRKETGGGASCWCSDVPGLGTSSTLRILHRCAGCSGCGFSTKPIKAAGRIIIFLIHQLSVFSCSVLNFMLI